MCYTLHDKNHHLQPAAVYHLTLNKRGQCYQVPVLLLVIVWQLRTLSSLLINQWARGLLWPTLCMRACEKMDTQRIHRSASSSGRWECRENTSFITESLSSCVVLCARWMGIVASSISVQIIIKDAAYSVWWAGLKKVNEHWNQAENLIPEQDGKHKILCT